MISLIIAWLILIFWGCKKEKKLYISNTNTLALRGICALEIMIGHIGLATNSIVLFPNRKAGILFVGIFFALSGYGLAYSYKEKRDYLKGFLWSKVKKILLPAFLIWIGYTIVDILFYKAPMLNILNLWNFATETNWYVWEVLIFYLLFWGVYKLFDNKKADIIIGCVSVLFVLLCFIFNVDNPWYGSTICFWGGIVFYRHEKKIREFLIDKWWMFLLGLVICGILILVFFIDSKGFVGLVCARNIAAITFSLLCFLILYRYHMGNKVSNYMGKISYDIFLIHPFVIKLLANKFSSDLLYAWLVIFITIAISILIYKTKKIFVVRK